MQAGWARQVFWSVKLEQSGGMGVGDGGWVGVGEGGGVGVGGSSNTRKSAVFLEGVPELAGTQHPSESVSMIRNQSFAWLRPSIR